MYSKSFEVAGIKAIVHTETGRHVYKKRALFRRIMDSVNDDDIESWLDFVRVVVQSDNVEGVAFPWPTDAATAEELKQAYECWLDLPGTLLKRWEQELNTVDEAPAKDSDLSSDTPPNA